LTDSSNTATQTGSGLLSPTLTTLAHALQVDASSALEVFWQDVATTGTPLVELLADDDNQKLVTFLWRDAAATNVVLFSYLFWKGSGFALLPMQQLATTDLWYLSVALPKTARATYWFAPNDSLEPITDANYEARILNWQSDPFNSKKFPDSPIANEPSFSVLALADGSSQESTHLASSQIMQGHVKRHTLASEILGNTRTLWVYTPYGYNLQTRVDYGLALFFDGQAALELLEVPTIFDKLIAAGLIPPMLVVMLDSPDAQARNRELACYPPLATFLSQELLPWLRSHYNNLTQDPTRNLISGASYGGLAAAYAGLMHPEIFGKVLAQSGSFWWRPADISEHAWLTRQFVQTPILPLVFYLEVGLFERTTTPDDGPTQLQANRHLRDVLQAKGYKVHYSEYWGGHEYLNWSHSLANALSLLLGF
jgi:enterochelin esterase family protein